jgi:tetratricopeptide (TPR) repeat protein
MALLPHDRRPVRTGCVLALLLLLAGCGSDSRELMSQADANWRKGRYAEAVEINKAVYRLDSRSANAGRALLNIANIYYLNLRELKQAIEHYNKLIDEFPGSPEAIQAHRQLAAIYANEVVDLDQAIAQYDRLLLVQNLEDRQEILLQRADAYLKRGEYDRSLRELRSLEESGAVGHLADQVALKIGSIYQIQKRYEEAVEPFRKVLTSSCESCRRHATLSLAETYENLFEFDKAVATLRLLDKTAENEAFVREEVERLEVKRRQAASGALDWPQPRTPESAPPKSGQAAKPPAKKPPL